MFRRLMFLLIAGWIGLMASHALWSAPVAPAEAARALAVPADVKVQLVRELHLSAKQQSQLDGLLAEMQPRIDAARALPEAQRRTAREPLVERLHREINAMLDPDQRAAYELMQARAEMAQRELRVPGAVVASDLAAAGDATTASARRARAWWSYALGL